MAEKWLTAQDCADRIGVTKKTFLQNYATRPDFPDRKSLSKKIFFFRDSEVTHWIARKSSGRPSVKQVN